MGLGWSWDTILQLRKDLDGGETHILKLVWVWDDAWMELRCNLLDLDGGEMLPGCRWDVNIRTQIEVRFNWDKEETWIWEPRWRGDKSRDLDGVEMGPGLSWDAYLETWIGWYGTRMELRYYSLVEKWPGWRWNTHLETCMGLRWCLDGTKMQFGRPGWRWNGTWM